MCVVQYSIKNQTLTLKLIIDGYKLKCTAYVNLYQFRESDTDFNVKYCLKITLRSLPTISDYDMTLLMLISKLWVNVGLENFINKFDFTDFQKHQILKSNSAIIAIDNSIIARCMRAAESPQYMFANIKEGVLRRSFLDQLVLTDAVTKKGVKLVEVSTPNEVTCKVCVSTIVKKDDRYLLVKEATEDGWRYSQPSGHLEDGETLQEAAIREITEETGYLAHLTGFIGSYVFQQKSNSASYVMLTFSGQIDSSTTRSERIDAGIGSVEWLTIEEIQELDERSETRNPMVLKSILQSQNQALPLDAVDMFNL